MYLPPVRDLKKTNLICTHCACGWGELSEVFCEILGSSPKDLRTSFYSCTILLTNFITGCIVLWDAGLDESCWTNLKPTESRWHHIFVGLEWIPGGFCNNTSLLCPPCPAGSLEPQPGNFPSYPPVPRSWKLVTGHACWYDLSQSRSPGRGWCQLSPPPVGYKKIIWNVKNSTWKIIATVLPAMAFSPPSLVALVSSPYLYRAFARLIRTWVPLCEPTWAAMFPGCCWWDFLNAALHLLLYSKFLLGIRRDIIFHKLLAFSEDPLVFVKSLPLHLSNIHTSQPTTWLDKPHSKPCKGLTKK